MSFTSCSPHLRFGSVSSASHRSPRVPSAQEFIDYRILDLFPLPFRYFGSLRTSSNSLGSIQCFVPFSFLSVSFFALHHSSFPSLNEMIWMEASTYSINVMWKGATSDQMEWRIKEFQSETEWNDMACD